jgi:hypothetical protein
MPNKIENKQTGIQEKREDRVTLAVCFRKRTQTQTWMRRQIVVGWAVILLPLFHPVINLFTNQIYLAGNQPHNHFYRQRQQIFSPLRAYQTSICHHRQTRLSLCLQQCGCLEAQATIVSPLWQLCLHTLAMENHMDIDQQESQIGVGHEGSQTNVYRGEATSST